MTPQDTKLPPTDDADDPVEHPAHYTSSSARCPQCGRQIECIDVVEHMSFPLGNAIKYLWRAGIKTDDPIQDLKKSVWYIQREIGRLMKAACPYRDAPQLTSKGRNMSPSTMTRTIIESPYAGDVTTNQRYARACLLDSLRRGEKPFASHLLYTQVLNDLLPEERRIGMAAGFAWYDAAQQCVVYCDRGISSGMLAGIREAFKRDVPRVYRLLGGEWT